MDPDPQAKSAKPAKTARETTRDDRLKAALKANMARRKAQALARLDRSGNDNKNG